MNVSTPSTTLPPGGHRDLQILGLRPVPALAALGLALAGAWVLASTMGNDESPGQTAVANRPAAASSLATATPVPGAVRASRPTVAAMPAPSGQPLYPAAVPQPAPTTVPVAGSSTPDVPGTSPAPTAADPSATMYLTIVGDQTYVTYGPSGQRTPRVDDLVAGRGTRASPEGPRTAESAGDVPSAADGEGVQVAAEDSGPADLSPEPQQCPRTLPPGSTQADADQLTSLYSCRYLSGCRVGDGQCTFFYQGRG